MLVSSCRTKSFPSCRLENIDEETSLSPNMSCAPPETPTESMEFLARSWSVSAMELSKALSTTHIASDDDHNVDKSPLISSQALQDATSMASKNSQLKSGESPPISPRDSEEMKELFLLHHALNPDFISNQQLLKNGLMYKNMLRGKTMGRWLKDQKERKKQEMRTHNAQLHAAVSVVGVAAAVAAFAASSVPLTDMSAKTPSKTSAAIASASALVASHCIEIAEDMGAHQDQILSVVKSATNARSNGDIMALTAAAATALRGAAILRARMQKGYGATTFALVEEKGEEGRESTIAVALNFVSSGGELLKRTRKGALHWKEVSFNVNSNWQVVAKMKSKHMAGTFTKKKKCVVFGVHCDIPAWPGREREESSEQRVYFGIKTADRIIEFECRNKAEKQMWTEGVQNMLNFRANIP